MTKFRWIQKIRNKIRVDKSSIIKLGKNIKLVGCDITMRGKNNHLEIEDGVRIHRSTIEIMGDNCLVKIGKNSMIGDNCYLVVKEENIHLTIGKSCGLSRNIKVMTSDGHPIFQNNIRINNAQNIVIGNNIWIGDNVTILKGVEVSNDSVIGINSVVTKSVPPNTVVAGNPAKVIKENITWKP